MFQVKQALFLGLAAAALSHCGSDPSQKVEQSVAPATEEIGSDAVAETDEDSLSIVDSGNGILSAGWTVKFKDAYGNPGIVRGLVTNYGAATTIDHFVGYTFDRATYGYGGARNTYIRQAKANIADVCSRLAAYGTTCNALRTAKYYPWNLSN